MRSALARTRASSSPKSSVDVVGGSIFSKTLLGIMSEDVDDGNSEGIFRIWPEVFPTPASELAKPDLDAKAALVRTSGYTRAAAGRAAPDCGGFSLAIKFIGADVAASSRDEDSKQKRAELHCGALLAKRQRSTCAFSIQDIELHCLPNSANQS